jgi:hypothetical protein
VIAASLSSFEQGSNVVICHLSVMLTPTSYCIRIHVRICGPEAGLCLSFNVSCSLERIFVNILHNEELHNLYSSPSIIRMISQGR